MKTRAQYPVLVTGASGFIGGHLVRRLIRGHWRVGCLVRTQARVDELRSSGARLWTGDVTNRCSIETALAQSQAATVFHLAGVVKTARGNDFARVNAGGVEAVAAACAGRVEPPVLVVVSSLSAAGPSTANRLHQEGDRSQPLSNYGRSKLAGEVAAARFADPVPLSIVRPPIVYGAGDRAVLEMFRLIARWGLHVVPGWRGPDERLSLIHVEDLVEGLLLVAERGERLRAHGAPGQGVYYLAGAEQSTYAQLGQAMAEALGRKRPTMLRIPGWLLKLAGMGGDLMGKIGGHAGWINRDKMTEALAGSWTCSAAKALAQLGWAPTSSLAERLRETVQGYRQAGWLASSDGDIKRSENVPRPS